MELVIALIGLEVVIINDIYFSILVVFAFLPTLMPPVSLSLLIERVKLVK